MTKRQPTPKNRWRLPGEPQDLNATFNGQSADNVEKRLPHMKNCQEQQAAPVVSTDAHAPSTEAGPPRLAFSVKETAELLGVCEKTIRRLISRGLLRPSKALRHLLIPRQEIERFLKETTSP